MEDEYFIKRNLYPNLDFFSGLLMKVLHIPERMYNVIFVLARSAGWIAHWREMMGDKVIKIYRPRQIYVGLPEREFVPIDRRIEAPGFNFKSYKEV